MPKSLALGNGHILICLDKHGYLRDFYFPFVGLENHVGSIYSHKIGVWVDNTFSWLHDKKWTVTLDQTNETMAGNTNAVNSALGLWVNTQDIVYNEKNIFIRKITIHNSSDSKRTIKLFLNQEFQIYGVHFGDTGYFDPIHNVVIHYKGSRVFLINAITDSTQKSFDDYSIGMFKIEGKEGTFKDAEDGVLSKNAIEHGPVDSVMGVTCEINGHESETIYYWISAALSIEEVHELNEYVLKKTPEHCMKTTKDFWHAWVNKNNADFSGLDEPIVDLFKKSLLMIKTHIDDNGSILASGDADVLHHGKDTYSYIWPRDAAFTALALDLAGDYQNTERFFRLSHELIGNEGYFLHRYRADTSLGSSWHPWIRDGKISLPIQEDETALVIYALWQHYEVTHDLELVEDLYNSLIEKAADFMVSFRDKTTGLPNPSYDLWEETYGVATFTSASVYAALLSAAKFSELLGKRMHARRYHKAAVDVKDAIVKYLFNKKEGIFYKTITTKGQAIHYNTLVDASSIYGVFKFGVMDIDDKILSKAINLYEQRLLCRTQAGGIARYEGDMYYRAGDDSPGNPWIITSLWFAQYYIAKAKSLKDLEVPKNWLDWTVSKALPSGVLSEQLDPYTGEQLSAAPLTWSHAEFVVTVAEYLNKLKKLKLRE